MRTNENLELIVTNENHKVKIYLYSSITTSNLNRVGDLWKKQALFGKSCTCLSQNSEQLEMHQELYTEVGID